MRKINRKNTRKEKQAKEVLIANIQDATYNLKKYILTLNKALPDAMSFGKNFFGNFTKLKHFLHNGENQYTNIEQDCDVKVFENAEMLLLPREFDSEESEKDFYEMQQMIKYMKLDEDESNKTIYETEVDRYSFRDFLKAVELILKGFSKEQNEKVVHAILERSEEKNIDLVFKNSNGGINPKLKDDFYREISRYFLEDLKITSNTAVFLPTPLMLQFRAMLGEENSDRVILNKITIGNKIVENFYMLFGDIKVELIDFRLEKRAMIVVQKDKLNIDINKEGYINFTSDALSTNTPEFASLDEIKSLKVATRPIELEVHGECFIVGVNLVYDRKAQENVTIIRK